MGRKQALITGITGQDGSYLAELLLDKGYEVHGLVRRTSTFNRARIDHLFPGFQARARDITLHYGDLTDSGSVSALVAELRPDEVYHLGGQSHVGVSFMMRELTGNVTGLSAERVLAAIRRFCPAARYYQASSSEMFGLTPPPHHERSAFHPRSPYGIAKMYAHWTTVNYRESYGLHASNGILFNHESPRRGENFVSRKITLGIAEIMARKRERLSLGNLDARRDWGYAKDYVEGMWRMLQEPEPDDYVLATNETHSVREFVEEAGRLVGMEIEWQGSGLGETGVDRRTGKTVVERDPRYVRPAEVHVLQGDYAKAKAKLGWEPTVRFREVVRLMLAADLERTGAPQRL
jgi:GDPmannose 4,6-dehydratase